MQNIFAFSKSWHDPVPGLKQLILIIPAILFIESLAFIINKTLPNLSHVYILGFIRLTDIVILMIFGPWSFKEFRNQRALINAISLAIIFLIGGLLFLKCWRIIFGSSLLKLNARLFDQPIVYLIAFFLTSCLLSPIAEELFFRGFLYRKMRDKLNPWITIGVISFLFTAIHFWFNGQVIFPLMGSLIFSIGYEKNKFIMAPIFLHITGNFMIYTSPLIKIF